MLLAGAICCSSGNGHLLMNNRRCEASPCSLHSEGEETAGFGKTGEGKEIGETSRDERSLSFAVATGHFAPSSAANRGGHVTVAGSLLGSSMWIPSYDHDSDKGGNGSDFYVTAAVIGGVGISALKRALTCEPHSLPHVFIGKNTGLLM